MNAVCDCSNRNFAFFFIRPDFRPHLTGHFAVFLAHGVAIFRHSKGEDRHVETGVGIQWIDAELKEPIPVCAKLLIMAAEIFFEQGKWKHVRPGGEWSVRGEYGSLPDLLNRVFKF